MMAEQFNVTGKGGRMHLQTLKRGLAGALAIGLGAAVLALAAGPVRAAEPVLAVEAGSQRTVALDKAAERVAVGNGEIVQVKVIDKKQLLLQGIKPGATSLLVWSKGTAAPQGYRVQVNKAAGAGVLEEYPGLHLKSSSDLLLLEGKAADMASHEAARQVALHADGSGQGPLLDTAQLAYNGEVQIDVRVVEFSRKVLKQAGFNLISNTHGFTFGTFAPSSLSSTELTGSTSATRGISGEFTLPVSQALNLVMGSSSEGLLSILSMLEGNGFARTLAQPTLVAQSGQTANFLAGGEFPVPVPQALGQTTIQYKPYGIRLDVAPTVLAENRIALKIAPEVSDLDFEKAIAISGVTVPSLITRRADTSIELGNGESFVIGGLVSQSVVKNLDKIPGLGDIPVLGLFFKSARLSREDKELLIIVTPKLVRPMAAGSQIGPLPGAEMADYNPSLWEMLVTSDKDEAARFTGLSK